MADRIGEQFGNYRLVRLLGTGGFAEVYLGEHIHLHSLVAVKVLLARMIAHEEDAFLQEARLIASLEHPSIVRVLDCGIERQSPFLIMSYAPHGTLRQRYPRGTRLPLGQILSYTQQVTSALSYAHSRRIIHRDIKPENILVGSRQEILLSDFGIALISASTSTQSTQPTAGTIAYMAPEQILGKPRLASDQYALGVVLYEWLSGERPFQGSFAELCAQHLSAPPPPLIPGDPSIPPAVEAVVMKALSKDPSLRFPTVHELMQALEEAVRKNQAGLLDTGLPSAPRSPAITLTSTDREAIIPTVVKSPQLVSGINFGVLASTQAPVTPAPSVDDLERARTFVEQVDSQQATMLSPKTPAQPHRSHGDPLRRSPRNEFEAEIVTVVREQRKRAFKRGPVTFTVLVLFILALLGGSLFFSLQHGLLASHLTTHLTSTVTEQRLTPGITPQIGSSPSSLNSPTVTHQANAGATSTTTRPTLGTSPTVQATTTTPTSLPTQTTPTPAQVPPTLLVSPTFRVNSFTNCQWDSHGGVGQGPICPYTVSNPANANAALVWSVTSNNPKVIFSATSGTVAPGQSVTITATDPNACPLTDTFTFQGNTNTVQTSLICTTIVSSPDTNTFDNTWCTHNGNWSCVIQVSADSANSQDTPWNVVLETPDPQITFSPSQGTLAPGASAFVTITIPASDCPTNNQFRFGVPGSLPNGSSWLGWSC